MRAVVATTALILLSGCAFERATRPQPQKSALSQCYSGACAPPIFVVDGKQLPEDGIDLNPSEIETVEVFKGDLAVKQYGEAARIGGVVVITTKRAARGAK